MCECHLLRNQELKPIFTKHLTREYISSTGLNSKFFSLFFASLEVKQQTRNSRRSEVADSLLRNKSLSDYSHLRIWRLPSHSEEEGHMSSWTALTDLQLGQVVGQLLHHSSVSHHPGILAQHQAQVKHEDVAWIPLVLQAYGAAHYLVFMDRAEIQTNHTLNSQA